MIWRDKTLRNSFLMLKILCKWAFFRSGGRPDSVLSRGGRTSIGSQMLRTASSVWFASESQKVALHPQVNHEIYLIADVIDKAITHEMKLPQSSIHRVCIDKACHVYGDHVNYRIDDNYSIILFMGHTLKMTSGLSQRIISWVSIWMKNTRQRHTSAWIRSCTERGPGKERRMLPGFAICFTSYWCTICGNDCISSSALWGISYAYIHWEESH